MNKKGNIFDNIWIGVVLFAFIIITIVSLSFFTNLKDDLLADDSIAWTSEANASLQTFDSQPTWFDNGVLFLMVGLIIGVVVSAFFIDTHPVFFVLGFIILILSGFIWVAMEETGADLIASDDDYVNLVENSMPKTDFILGNLFKIMMVISFLVLVVLFAKSRMNTGGGGF